MENEVLKYVSKFISLSEEETKAITEDLCIRNFKKGSILLNEGDISKEGYFILKGCIRQYSIVDGEEKTTNFFTEEQWVLSRKSYTQKIPADHYISCVEDCILVIGNIEKETKFYKKISTLPNLQSLSRLIMEKDIGEYQEMLATYITDTPEQRYLKLLKNRPELIQRVPQYQLASYIGVKPESLSRIRKRISSKKSIS
jgi:CRP-like cAMP-binding protein